MDRDGFPFWPFWENVRSWWAIRELPNVLFVHFESLKRDMAAEMRRIAAFLDIAIDESRWPSILEYCSFDWMKRNATKSVPLGGAFWDAGAEVFINKGVNGRWRVRADAGGGCRIRGASGRRNWDPSALVGSRPATWRERLPVLVRPTIIASVSDDTAIEPPY